MTTKIHWATSLGLSSATYEEKMVHPRAKKQQIPKLVALIDTGNNATFPKYATLKELEIPNLLPRMKIESKSWSWVLIKMRLTMLTIASAYDSTSVFLSPNVLMITPERT